MSTPVLVSEEEARDIALVRALEEQQSRHRVFDADLGREAGRQVWKTLGQDASTLSDADWVRRFLLPRARWLLETAAQAQPFVRGLRDTPMRLRVLPWLLLPIAIVGAFAVDRLAQPDRINLMALPFVGFVLWNWAVFLAMALKPVWDIQGRLVKTISTRCTELRSDVAARHVDTGLASVAHSYTLHWAAWAQGAWRARVSVWLHSVSLAIATGLLASLAWAAWHTEFQVGWTSTLCDARCVYAIHAALSLPVSPLVDVIGAQPFDAVEIELRHGWRESAPTDGLRWFRLTGALLIVTVVLPRVVLLVVARSTLARRKAQVPLPINESYFAALRTPPASSVVAEGTAPVARTADSPWLKLKHWIRKRRS